jgi:hypothetical protein
MAEFSLFTNEVRLSILDENNSFPFIRSAISRVGYNKIAVSYKRNKRTSGKTNYNFLTINWTIGSRFSLLKTIIKFLPFFKKNIGLIFIPI